MSRQYILQWGSLAGWPYRIAHAVKEAGYDSVNVIPDTADFEDLERQLPYDRVLYQRHTPKLIKLAKRMAFLCEAARTCRLVHYHGSVITRVKWHFGIEGTIFRRRGVPMLMSFTGSDARIVSEARAVNRYFYLEDNPGRDDATRAYLKNLSRSIRYVATDCEMIRYVSSYFEKCFVFRQPVDLREIQFQEPRDTDCPIVLHVPTNTLVKGTEYILMAVERLKREGYRFEFRLKRRLTQRDFYKELESCDIYVDEIRLGAHGLTPVESMASGKPTLTYIRDDLVSAYPQDLPLVNANPDTIYQKLRDLISDAGARKEIGYAGRRYVEKYHDITIVARDLIQAYREIGY